MAKKTKAYLLYDERMTLHEPPSAIKCEEDHYELPSRITSIMEKLTALEKRLVAADDDENDDDLTITKIYHSPIQSHHSIHISGNRRNSKNKIVHENIKNNKDGNDDNNNDENQNPKELEKESTTPKKPKKNKRNKSSSSSSSSLSHAIQPPSPPSQTHRFLLLPCHPLSRSTILLTHSPIHYQKMLHVSSLLTENDLVTLTKTHNEEDDIYFSRHTFTSASLSAGGVVNCVDAVFGNGKEERRAIAVVRPPGHHACREKAMGFCFFNNVAIAANYALHSYPTTCEKVLILDWDIHHGNGTQELTYHNPNILFLSLHRSSIGQSFYFFPGTGKPSEVGFSEAAGTNANVAWEKAGIGDKEYAAAFSELVLPMVRGYEPDLILVSCGFDAADGDPIGDCLVTPEMFYRMMRSLLETIGERRRGRREEEEEGSGCRVVVALEGGYNLEVIGLCMEAVALALLDEEWNDKGGGGIKNVEEEDDQCNVDDDEDDSNNDDNDTSMTLSKKRDQWLSNGRKVLNKYWRHDNNDDCLFRGQISRHAFVSINKTIRALKNTLLWKNVLKEIPIEAIEGETTTISKHINEP